MKETLRCICSVYWDGCDYVFEVRGEVVSYHKTRGQALRAMDAWSGENL